MSDQEPQEPQEVEEVEEVEEEEVASDSDVEIDPNNPLLERVQRALKTQLTAALEQLQLEIHEKTEALKEKRKNHEDSGVQLYAVQQQVARLQLELEKTQDQHSSIVVLRENSEKDLEVAEHVYKEKQLEFLELQKKYDEKHKELDRISLTVKQVEVYNEEIKKQIAVTRRATYKAEETLSGMEKSKDVQDTLIEKLYDQMKSLTDEQAMLEAQIQSQKQETTIAKQTLSEAAKEMEGIQFEKTQLLQQWKSSLIGMQRRDEALQATEEGIQKQEEELLSLKGELSGYKTRIKGEQDKNERVTVILNKIQTEMAFLNKKLEQLQEQRAQLSEQYTFLTRSLEANETELASANISRTQVRNQVSALYKTINSLNDAVGKLKTRAALSSQAKQAAQKGQRSTQRLIERLQSTIHEKELQRAELENQATRIEVSILNTQATNAEGERELKSLEEKLKEKEGLIDRYEADIRRRNLEIEKKQTEVDKLNRKYDALVSTMIDENTGPLEATINNLNKQIAAVQLESNQLQQFWLRKQNELVLLMKEAEEMSTLLQTLRSKHTILLQKKKRLENSIDIHTRETNQIESSRRSLQTSQLRINEGMLKCDEEERRLAETNLELQAKFEDRLKAAESEAAEIEVQILALRTEREDTIKERADLEKALLLLEKKIQLVKETQSALDPTVGASEIGAMKKEIHRMELRKAQLKRQQDICSQEMEKAIVKRSHIALKGKVRTQAGKNNTVMSLKKSITEAKKKVKNAEHELQEVEASLQRLQDHQLDLTNALDDGAEQCEALRREETQREADVDKALLLKQKGLDELTTLQRTAKRYEEAVNGKYTPTVRAERLERESDTEARKTDRILALIQDLKEKSPAHATAFDVMYSAAKENPILS